MFCIFWLCYGLDDKIPSLSKRSWWNKIVRSVYTFGVYAFIDLKRPRLSEILKHKLQISKSQRAIFVLKYLKSILQMLLQMYKTTAADCMLGYENVEATWVKALSFKMLHLAALKFELN